MKGVINKQIKIFLENSQTKPSLRILDTLCPPPQWGYGKGGGGNYERQLDINHLLNHVFHIRFLLATLEEDVVIIKLF